MAKRTENATFKGIAEGKHPWEKQPGETSKAYGGFCVYRDMGPVRRSVLGACKEAEGAPRSFTKWFKNLMWQERAQAWDEYLNKESLDRQLTDVVEARKRIVQLGQALQTLGGHEMEVMLATAKEQKRNGKKESLGLKKSEVVRFIKEGTRLELIGLGEPVEPQGEGAEGATSYAELARIAEDWDKKNRQKEEAEAERSALAAKAD